ncbi:hypothetical protein H8S95_11360 [Pontibacter sp. KCTC 32443]|nr:hypothetical protein [Pontibacter sp. KCTC 32443]
MVEVFKTDVSDDQTAAIIQQQLQHKIPGARINFDLEDCDNILRVEYETAVVEPVTKLMNDLGFYCKVLD